jgi:hypothetical protein
MIRSEVQEQVGVERSSRPDGIYYRIYDPV